MKGLFTKYVWLQLILSVLLLFGGTLVIVFVANGRQDVLRDALNIIVAVILFLFGAFAILATVIFEPKKIVANGLIYGAASIALGVFLCTKKMFLIDYLVDFLAIFFIVFGGIELIKGIIAVTQKEKKIVSIVVLFVLAAIFIAGGILSLIFRNKVEVVFCVIAGVILFLLGVYEFLFGVKGLIDVSKNRKKEPSKKVNKKKGKDNNQVDDNIRADKSESESEVVPVLEQREIKEIDYTKDEDKEKAQ